MTTRSSRASSSTRTWPSGTRSHPNPSDQQSHVHDGSVLLGQGGHGAGRTLAIPDVLTGPTALTSTSRCCRRARTETARDPISARPASRSRRPARRKEQAWEFVKFAAGPVGQGLIGESGLFVPVLTVRVRLARDSPRRTAGSAISTCSSADPQFGLSAGHPGVGTDRCTDGSRLRTGAAGRPPGDFVTDRAGPRRRRGAIAVDDNAARLRQATRAGGTAGVHRRRTWPRSRYSCCSHSDSRCT